MYDSGSVLEKVRKLVGLASDDSDLDEKLKLIIGLVEMRLQKLLKGLDIPKEFTYIVVEVAVVRFNRIGSEGVRIDSVEGESQHYVDEDDFDKYMDEINDYLESVNGVRKVRFI